MKLEAIKTLTERPRKKKINIKMKNKTYENSLL